MNMSDNKTMIRFYLGLFLISALLTYVVDLNSRLHFIVLNSPLISNSFCFSILSGILTGVSVALVVEIKQYCSRKRQVCNTLYAVALELYNLLTIQKAGIAYYIDHPAVAIPQNLCGPQAQQPIYYCVSQFRMIDYNTFRKNDNINEALKKFINEIVFVENMTRNFTNISIAYNETKIKAIEKQNFKSEVTSASSIMLSALQKGMSELEKCLSDIDDFCRAFEKMDNSRYKWSQSKGIASDMEKQIKQDIFYNPYDK